MDGVELVFEACCDIPTFLEGLHFLITFSSHVWSLKNIPQYHLILRWARQYHSTKYCSSIFNHILPLSRYSFGLSKQAPGKVKQHLWMSFVRWTWEILWHESHIVYCSIIDSVHKGVKINGIMQTKCFGPFWR